MNVAEPPATTGSVDPNIVFEVVDGVIVEKQMSAESTWVAARLDHRLGPFVEDNRLGTVVPEMLFVFEPNDKLKRRPDVAFVSAERWPLDRRPPGEGDWPVVPDLAVEVVSRNDSMDDVIDKVAEYFDHGVRQVWVILLRVRQVYVYDSLEDMRIVAEPAALATPLVPGWSLPLATLFGPR